MAPSPLNYVKSYSLSEHGRWSIIAPILFRVWLRDIHIKPLFVTALKQVLGSVAHNIEQLIRGSISAADLAVVSFAALARSNMQLMAPAITAETRTRLPQDIADTRGYIHDLLEAGAVASRLNPHSRRTSRAAFPIVVSPSSQARRAASQMQASSPMPDPELAGQTIRSSRYTKDQYRPNVHIGLHYSTQAAEYGLISKVHVLMGEGKHKYVRFR